MRLDHHLVRVFTLRAAGGVPVAVFPSADGANTAAMQSIAAELGLARTVFVTTPRRADCARRLRVFTPRRELPLSVGASLAAAQVCSLDNPWDVEMGVLKLTVLPSVTSEGPARSVALPRTVVGGAINARPAVAAALGLSETDLDPGLPVVTATAGVAYLLVPLRDREALARAWVVPAAWATVVEKARVPGVLAYVRTDDTTVQCRTLPVAQGFPEDPASGAACGALGLHLAFHNFRQGLPWGGSLRCEHALDRGRPSVLQVTVDGSGEGEGAVQVAGATRTVGGGWLDLGP